MGLDYSVVFVLPAAEEPRLRARLRQAGTVEELPAPFGTAVTLDFPLDDALRAFLDRERTEALGQPVGSPAFRGQGPDPRYFPTDTTGRVGYWYWSTLRRHGLPDVYVQLTAATSHMSRLLERSAAVQQWFRELACELHATAFLDLEEQGGAFFCRAGQAMFATVDEDGRVQEAAPADRAFVAATFEEYGRLLEG
jgi:hypothetical protein